MNLLYSVVSFILISSSWPTVQSCFNNQRTGFCPRKRIVHQAHCPGVVPWACNWAELRCGCVDGTARRKDGKCVKPAECAGPKKPVKNKGEGDIKGTENTAGKESTPSAEEFDNPNGIMYFSGGSNGCPQDQYKCAEACATLGFPGGVCGPFLSEHCYCTGHQSKEHRNRSPLDTDKVLRFYPYGHVMATGDIVLQLKETHGCPQNEANCFLECNKLGMEGAFCRQKNPHYCVCEAHTSTNMWDDTATETHPETQEAITGCTSQDFCSSYCSSLEAEGFCSRDESPVCYCYQMYPYGPTSAKAHPQKPDIYKSGNHFASTRQFLQSRVPIALVLISTAAWTRSKCICMQATFVEALNDYATREVVCQVPQKSRNGLTTVEKEKANITFNLKYGDGATTISLTSDGHRRRLPFGFQRSYVVLSATSTCVVVLINNVWRVKPLCALWGHTDARNNDETACFQVMEKTCMQPVSDVFLQSDRCFDGYREEMRRYRGQSARIE